MCILFVHVNPNPNPEEHRLIIATNRDEYYNRPATDARWHEGKILGGEDMEPGREGGMWFGFTTKETAADKKYCAATLLNLSGEKVENAKGRGKIVKDYLDTNLEFCQYSNTLKASTFSGFNLIAVEISKTDANVYQYSNSPSVISIYQGKQTLGFGNSPTMSPLVKVTKGRYKFEEIITKPLETDKLADALLELLKDKTSHMPDEELEKRNPTAYPLLSSIFVRFKQAGYGTRAHSILLIDYDWNLYFTEHAMKQPIDIENPEWNVNKFQCRL